MDFTTGKELLDLCTGQNLPISAVMLRREMELGKCSEEEIRKRLARSLQIMEEGTHEPVKKPRKSMSGLVGGEAKAFYETAFSEIQPEAADSGPSWDLGGSLSEAGRLCGSVLSKAIAYSMAVLEVNASMGLIVAAPTAGSAGVLPGAMMAVKESFGMTEERILDGLLNAGAIGYLLMRNASVSGAEAGCQAEVGAASAMTASALVELMGGSPKQCFYGASLAISNLLGLVCDPIAGLVEVPCQSRNAVGVANAFTCAQMALSKIAHPIPFDEMAEAMYRVGRSLPYELRESAKGGNAGTPTGCRWCGKADTV